MTAHCPHCKGELSHPINSPQVLAALESVSTSTEAQEQRILEALRAGPKSTDELRSIGAYQVSARIFKLRQLGHNIHTELFNGIAADGQRHFRMARYSLISEALPLGSDKQAEAEACTG